MKSALAAFFLFTSISCSALENIILSGYSFPLNNNWKTIRLLEDGAGIAIKIPNDKYLIVQQSNESKSLVTLEDGSSISIVQIHQDKIHQVNTNSKSKIYQGIYDSFSETKELKSNNISFFIEKTTDIPQIHVAYIVTPSLISISTTMTKDEFLNFLKSIKIN